MALGYGGGEAVAQDVAVTGPVPAAGAAEMLGAGEPIALGTYYRWTQGRWAEPH